MRPDLRPITAASLFLALFLTAHLSWGQQRPKLVVGMVVDQMRYDYLYRYDDYGEDGFKRLMRDGFVVHDCHFNYSPTYTGPGHACIYTGTGPSVNGIIGNNWYDPISEEMVYCAADDSATSLGTSGSAGKMSPHRLLSTTMGDQLRLATNKRGKVIGIAIKDRGAVLPAGHLANAAYWYDSGSGNFISSDYYTDKLPRWVSAFNGRNLVETYLNQDWTLLLDKKAYDESQPDGRPYEKPLIDGGLAQFPYRFKAARREWKNRYLPVTPWGNALTLDFARAAIEAEDLGADDHTDLLAVSFSSPDYAGHQFGPQSMEIQDMYLRLDQQIAEFLNYLDENIGSDNYMLFLTADHGAAYPAGMISPPAGYFNRQAMADSLSVKLVAKMGIDPIVNISNQQIYLDRQLDSDQYEEAIEIILYESNRFPGIQFSFATDEFDECPGRPEYCEMLRRGYLPGRSGDILFVLKPGWISDSYSSGGTTHGSFYNYDTHVPLIFYGAGIPSGASYERQAVEDIAPTITQLLRIARPSGTTGRVIDEMLEELD